MRKEIVALEKLVLVNTKAAAFAAAVEATQLAKYELDASYLSWKLRNHQYHFIERGSVAWNSMLLGTKPWHRNLVNAKARERRARAALLKALEVLQ